MHVTHRSVAERCAAHPLPEGEVVFAQGERGELMYVVVEGEAQILIEGKVVETVGPGGILGEMALIDARAAQRDRAHQDALRVDSDRREGLHRTGHSPPRVRSAGDACSGAPAPDDGR